MKIWTDTGLVEEGAEHWEVEWRTPLNGVDVKGDDFDLVADMGYNFKRFPISQQAKADALAKKLFDDKADFFGCPTVRHCRIIIDCYDGSRPLGSWETVEEYEYTREFAHA